eukprot:1069761-Rhodomonas_salina.1
MRVKRSSTKSNAPCDFPAGITSGLVPQTQRNRREGRGRQRVAGAATWAGSMEEDNGNTVMAVDFS